MSKLTGIFNLFLGVGIIVRRIRCYINRGRVELGTVALERWYGSCTPACWWRQIREIFISGFVPVSSDGFL